MRTARWRVPTTVPAVKLILAAALVVATVTVSRDVIAAVAGLVVSAGVGLSGLRDLLAPVRLEADPEVLTVITGFGARHRYLWSDVERVRIDDRRRLLGRSVLLEIDVGTKLYFLGRYDLGAPPLAALDEIIAVRGG